MVAGINARPITRHCRSIATCTCRSLHGDAPHTVCWLESSESMLVVVTHRTGPPVPPRGLINGLNGSRAFSRAKRIAAGRTGTTRGDVGRARESVGGLRAAAAGLGRRRRPSARGGRVVPAGRSRPAPAAAGGRVHVTCRRSDPGKRLKKRGNAAPPSARARTSTAVAGRPASGSRAACLPAALRERVRGDAAEHARQSPNAAHGLCLFFLFLVPLVELDPGLLAIKLSSEAGRQILCVFFDGALLLHSRWLQAPVNCELHGTEYSTTEIVSFSGDYVR